MIKCVLFEIDNSGQKGEGILEKDEGRESREGGRRKQESSGGTAVACLSAITGLTFVFQSIA